VSRKFLSIRRRVVLIIACLIIWWASIDLYIQTQEPVEEHLAGSTWCLFPLKPFLKMAFNEDGTFYRRILIVDNPHFATANSDSGIWLVDEEDSETWIKIIGAENFLVKVHTYHFMQLEGDFLPLGRSVNLYRCNDTLPLR